MVDQIAKSLSSLGILEGDRVIILSENRPEWQISDLAIMSIGAITVPMYTTSTSDDYLHILKHSGARCAIVSNNELMKKILPAIEESQVCQNVIKIDNDNMTYKEIVNITSWDTILSESFSLEKKINNIKRSDTACIIYTSGTGGNPKGVMLSHGAMLRNCTGADELLKNLTLSLIHI